MSAAEKKYCSGCLEKDAPCTATRGKKDREFFDDAGMCKNPDCKHHLTTHPPGPDQTGKIIHKKIHYV